MSNSTPEDIASSIKGYFSKEVNDILFWKKKSMSMLTLTCINLAYFLVQFKDYSVITLACYSLMAILIFAFLVHKKASVKALGSPDDVKKLNEIVDSLRLSEEKAKAFTSLFSRYYTRGEEIILNTMKNQNPIYVFKVLVALFLIAKFGNYLSSLTIFWLGVNWLLIWPAIYAQNKTEIDSRYKATKDAILRNVDPLLKKIPSNLMNFDTTDLASPATPDEGKKNQ